MNAPHSPTSLYTSCQHHPHKLTLPSFPLHLSVLLEQVQVSAVSCCKLWTFNQQEGWSVLDQMSNICTEVWLLGQNGTGQQAWWLSNKNTLSQHPVCWATMTSAHASRITQQGTCYQYRGQTWMSHWWSPGVVPNLSAALVSENSVNWKKANHNRFVRFSLYQWKTDWCSLSQSEYFSDWNVTCHFANS